MKKKSLLVLTLVTLLLICSVGQVFAFENNAKADLVSKEEYFTTVQALYDKYGVNFKVIDDSNYTPCTREFFEANLISIEKHLTDTINGVNETKAKYEELLKQEEWISVNDINDINAITPYGSYIMKTLSGTHTIRQYLGWFYTTIKFSTTAELNVNNGEFTYVNSPGTWGTSLSFNLDSVTYTSRKWFVTSQGYAVMLEAEGNARFTYTVPVVGGVVSEDVPFAILRSFDQNS